MSADTIILVGMIMAGAGIGSFLNVVIYRLPLGKSIVWPGSACPTCAAPVRFYDNIPVLSYLILMGRCRNCKSPISAQYPCVEILSAVCAAIFYRQFGMTIQAVGLFVFAEALLVASVIDLEHLIIPDSISLGGMPVGLLFSFVSPLIGWKESLFGIAAGFGGLAAIAIIYEKVTKKEGMGGGDVKLLGTIGAFLGWQGAIQTIALSSFLGVIVGLPLMACRKDKEDAGIPFGPFLAAAAVAVIFYGNTITAWYLGTMGIAK